MIQQQVEEIAFEDVYITKAKRKAHDTNKVRDWLKLLAAYDENKMYDLKDKTIEQMHLKFLLSQEFWLGQLQRREKKQHISESDIEILFLGLEDSYCLHLCQKLEQLLLRQLNKDQTHKNKLRTNYVIAKIERLINMFKQSKNLFTGIRNYYIKTFNTKKARQFYYRQLRQAYDTHDILYDQYILWEPDQSLLPNAAILYQTAKKCYDSQIRQNTQHNLLERIDKKRAYQQIQSMTDLSQIDKLRYLRILCLGSNICVLEYVLKYQSIHQSDQQKVLQMYKALQLQNPNIVSKLYINYLIRRINKHVIQTQDQQYNNTWGSKVQYFRDQISLRIQNSNDTAPYRKQLYQTWMQVQTSLVKDKTSVCQVGEAFLQFVLNSPQLTIQILSCYQYYSKCLIKLGYYADAKQILKRCINHFTANLKQLHSKWKNNQISKVVHGNDKSNDNNNGEISQSKVQKLQFLVTISTNKYINFLRIYGNVKDIIEVEKSKIQINKMVRQINQTLNYQTISNLNNIQNKNISISKSQQKQIKNDINMNGQVQKQQPIKAPGQSKFAHYLKNKFQKSTQNIDNHDDKHKNQKNDQSRKPSKKVKLTKQEHENRQKSTQKIDLGTIHLAHPEIQIIPQPISSNSIQLSQQRISQKQSKMHTDSGSTLYIKGFPVQSTKQKIQSLLNHRDRIKQIRLIQKKGQPQNYCYIDMLTPEDAQVQVQQNKNKDKYTIAISRPPAAHNQDKTLFLCGLPHTATIEKIKHLFTEQQRDSIVDIRLKLDQHRNIAYVDFDNAQTAKKTNQKYSSKALQMDSKKIFLKQSNSTKSIQQAKKLFRVVIIKQLAYKATQKDIIQYFKDYEIQDVFIPEDDKGKSKGFAYVKFKKDDEYKKVLEIKNGYIKGRKIEIQKSDRDLHRPKNQKKERSDKNEVRQNTKEKKDKDGVDNNYFSNLFK